VREAAKRLAAVIAALLMLPLAIVYRCAALAMGEQASFPGFSQLVSLVPGKSGSYLRRGFYAWVLPRCGAGSVVSFGTVFSHSTVELGRHAYVGVYCCIGDVTIEDDVLVGSHVSITNGSRQHGIERLDIPVRDQPGAWPRVMIGQDSWIGDRAVVMADVGEHCIVGAGAVVTRPVPDFAIVAGVPARILSWRGTGHTKSDQGSTEHDDLKVLGASVSLH